MRELLATVDWLGRSALSWPAAILGAVLTAIAGELLRFAVWIMDFDDIDFEDEDAI